MAKPEIIIGQSDKNKKTLPRDHFYYDQLGSKWGGNDVSRPIGKSNDNNGKDHIVTSPEFLTTELEWRARPANNDSADRALAINEINKEKCKLEGKKIQKK